MIERTISIIIHVEISQFVEVETQEDYDEKYNKTVHKATDCVRKEQVNVGVEEDDELEDYKYNVDKNPKDHRRFAVLDHCHSFLPSSQTIIFSKNKCIFTKFLLYVNCVFGVSGVANEMELKFPKGEQRSFLFARELCVSCFKYYFNIQNWHKHLLSLPWSISNYHQESNLINQ